MTIKPKICQTTWTTPKQQTNGVLDLYSREGEACLVDAWGTPFHKSHQQHFRTHSGLELFHPLQQNGRLFLDFLWIVRSCLTCVALDLYNQEGEACLVDAWGTLHDKPSPNHSEEQKLRCQIFYRLYYFSPFNWLVDWAPLCPPLFPGAACLHPALVRVLGIIDLCMI